MFDFFVKDQAFMYSPTCSVLSMKFFHVLVSD